MRHARDAKASAPAAAPLAPIGATTAVAEAINEPPERALENVALAYAQIAKTPLHAQMEEQALVLSADVAYDRAGRPYLILTLRDQAGCNIPARWWRYPYPMERRPTAGTVCWFRATADEFGGERQLTIVAGRPIAQADLSRYARTTRTALSTLQTRLDAEIAALDPALAALVKSVLSGEIYARYCEWPAAQRYHAAVRHGLLAQFPARRRHRPRTGPPMCTGSDRLRRPAGDGSILTA